MKKTALKTSLLTLGLFFLLTSIVSADTINDFRITLTVRSDSTVLVQEKITYDFGTSFSRHGIFRTIPLRNAKNEPINITAITVTNQEGIPYKFVTSISNDILTIKIGDPKNTIAGVNQYNITYLVGGAISYLDTYDELYWNVTGNDWNVEIKKVEATVVLPAKVIPLKQYCYFGPSGATDTCSISEQAVFSTPWSLQPRSGLTVAVGFSKGVVAVYTPPVQAPTSLFHKFWPIVLPLVTLVFMFLIWYWKGKDEKGYGIITTQYDVPHNLSPFEVAMVVNQKLHSRDLVAEIIYLASRGYLSITKVKQKSFLPEFLQSKSSYILRLEKSTKDPSLLQVDQDLLNTIFFGGLKKISNIKSFKQLREVIQGNVSVPEALVGTELQLSEMKFPGIMDILSTGSKKQAVENGYFTSSFAKNLLKKYFFQLIILAVILNLVIRMIPTEPITNFIDISIITGGPITILLFFTCIFVCIGIVNQFVSMMPKRTAKGVKTKELLLGLKQYIEIAEKDRINFHNAPEKNPALFEHLLPYAIVFKQEKKWAKAFESITHTSPSWYRGDTQNFSAVLFTSSLTSKFSSSFSSAAGTGGGSSGGGSSGGGGGGGGGGSW